MTKKTVGPFQSRLEALFASEKSVTNKEIAEKLGYAKNPNVISMFKSGSLKVPLVKIPALAEALGADPAHLLRLAFQEYMAELLPIIDKHLGLLDKDERALLACHRSVTQGRETRLPNALFDEYRALLKSHL
jgi:transcriptional regulator with XRE-family HTH domain